MSPPPSELVQAPQHGFRGDAEPDPQPRPGGLTVAISREAGSRGTTIARMVSEILGWQVFDHDTLDYLAQNDTARTQLLADVPPEARRWADEQFSRLQHARGMTTEGDAIRLIRLVLMVAARGNAVIVGRAAGFLLPPETTIHVRIVAPLEARVAYMAQELRLTRPEAVEEVRARDERRALFLKRMVSATASDPIAYDVVVNSDRLGVEGAAQFVGWGVRTKQMFVEIAGPDQTFARGTLDDMERP